MRFVEFDTGLQTYVTQEEQELIDTISKQPVKKRDLTLRSLEANLGDTCVWSQPVGGLFIWVRIPDDVDRSKLWSSSREEGVAYLPGQSFHYARKDVAYLRLAFGHLTPDQISEGIPVLARCLNAARTSNESRQFESLF